MPKKSGKAWAGRGSGRSGQISESLEKKSTKHFFGHDDRGSEDVHMKITKTIGGNKPRVSFKNQTRSRNKELHYHLEGAVKRILDDDYPMIPGANNNGPEIILQHGRGRGNAQRGRNSPLSHRGRMRIRNDAKMIPHNETVWYSSKTQSYRITIPFGHRYPRTFIMPVLLERVSPLTFEPIMYKVTENSVSFYVDDQKVANLLRNSDRKIVGSDGHKLAIRVEPGFPHYNIDQKMRDRMKQAMAKRYVQETNALDLSRFHLDPELIDDYYCSLSRPSMLIAVLEIVSAAISNLEALNLDHNQLHSFEKLGYMTKKFTNLKILYLGDNKIRELSHLNPLKDIELQELRMAGNPVCEKYKTRRDEYVSDIRGKFPKLQRLDGEELPAQIGFDVENDGVRLPPTQRMFVANATAQEIASQFLQQYFIIFDSDNRQPLLDAYHEHACFSLTLSLPHHSAKLSSYFTHNRNLKKIIPPPIRRRLLKVGRLPVVSLVTELPKTKHDLNSFTMDIGLVTEGMMLITVSGLFKETETKDEPLRYFNRTFVVVPEGSGYCIRNEQLHLSEPTRMQEKCALEGTTAQLLPPPSQVARSSSSAVNVAGPASTSSGGVSSVDITDEVRQQMTITLSQHTNMNLEWSLKCLKEVDWKYDIAMAAFQEFFKLGRIPPEAFKK